MLDWERGPITELRLIKAEESCDAETLKKYMVAEASYNPVIGAANDKNTSFGFDQGTFEIVGQAYWWSLKQGCYCGTGAQFGPTPGQQCTDAMVSVNNGCFDIPTPSKDYFSVDVINKHKFCAYRDDSYQLKDISHVGEDKKCNMTSKFTKLCGNTAGKVEEIYCIPAASRCPLTSVRYSTQGLIKTTNDPTKGTPLMDLKMSQNGGPCINHGEENSNPNKTSFDFFNDKYTAGCTSDIIGNNTYSTSPLYTALSPGYYANEYNILEQNPKNDDRVKTFEDI